MATTIRPRRMNHVNMVLEEFEAGVAHVEKAFGAEFLMDLPHAAAHAGLVEIGRVILEFFAPTWWLLNARYGPHFVGLEYEADMTEVRAALAERGVRIVRDIEVALHTLPADTLGVSFEFYDGNFHDNTWEPLGGKLMHSAAYWRDEHPLGLTGLDSWALLAPDLEHARDFLASLLGARAEGGIEERPEIGARVLRMAVSDDTVEIMAPTGPGRIADELARQGPGIRSIRFVTRDRAAARAWLEQQGLPLRAGTREGTLEVAAEANMGLLFEFG